MGTELEGWERQEEEQKNKKDDPLHVKRVARVAIMHVLPSNCFMLVVSEINLNMQTQTEVINSITGEMTCANVTCLAPRISGLNNLQFRKSEKMSLSLAPSLTIILSSP